jgi:hypothetical protein
MSKRRVLVLGLAMLALLGVLAAGLQTLEFRAGLPMPDREGPETGGPGRFPLPYDLLEKLFDVMPWLMLGIVILGVAIFRRKLLRDNVGLKIMVTLIVFLVFLAVIGLMPHETQPSIDEEELSQFEEEVIRPPEFWQPILPSPDWIEDTTQEQPVAIPGWVTYLAAAVLAVPVVWLGWRLARRAAQRYRKQVPEETLRQAAAQATAELRAGLDVKEVVIRCWARMAEILAARAGGDAPSITPREFAQLLARWGVHHEAVAKLTSLFEEVRYGDRADAPRREQALAALEAIEEAYGSA